MVSKVKKGYNVEKKARDSLIKDEYRITFKSIRYRFGCIDYANLFDIVAYKGQERLFISCKHFGNSNYYLPHQKEIKEFKEEYGKEGEIYALWIWKEYQFTDKRVKGEWIKIVI